MTDRGEGAARVLVVGAVNVDMVVRTPRLPGPGETAVGPGVERFGGGKGAGAAVAAERAGAEVRYVGAVGADDVGPGAVAELRAEGIDLDAVAVLRADRRGRDHPVRVRAGQHLLADSIRRIFTNDSVSLVLGGRNHPF